MNKKWLAGPYLVWMVGFIVIPLLLIVYYGLTDKSGAFTLANVLSISTPEHVKALYLSLGLSLVSTVICLLLAYPHPGMADPSGEKRCHQRHLNRPAPAEPEPDQHTGRHHPGHGLQLPAVYGASYL